MASKKYNLNLCCLAVKSVFSALSFITSWGREDKWYRKWFAELDIQECIHEKDDLRAGYLQGTQETSGVES